MLGIPYVEGDLPRRIILSWEPICRFHNFGSYKPRPFLQQVQVIEHSLIIYFRLLCRDVHFSASAYIQQRLKKYSFVVKANNIFRHKISYKDLGLGDIAIQFFSSSFYFKITTYIMEVHCTTTMGRGKAKLIVRLLAAR